MPLLLTTRGLVDRGLSCVLSLRSDWSKAFQMEGKRFNFKPSEASEPHSERNVFLETYGLPCMHKYFPDGPVDFLKSLFCGFV